MVMFNDRVVSGRDIVTSEQLSLLPKISEFQFLVAHHTWIRRATGLVFAGKITDHEFFELIRFIDHVMRDVEHVRDATRVRHGLWPATFILRPRNTVLRPHFHRHPNDVIALFAQQITSDAGIDSAAHAKKHALFVSRIHPRKIGESAQLVNRGPEVLILSSRAKAEGSSCKSYRYLRRDPSTRARDDGTFRLPCELSRNVNRHGKWAERRIPILSSA